MALPVLVSALLAGCGASSSNDLSLTSMPSETAQTGATKTGSITKDAPAASAIATTTTPAAGPAGKNATSVKAPAAAGQSPTKAAESLTVSATPGSNAYRIGPLDVLELSVFKVQELSRVVQVADTGTANFPLVGEITVVGRTAQEVERDLTKQLGAKYLQRPEVTLSVKEYNSQRVTVEGAVKKPGVFPIRGKATLLQFLAMAEGLDPTASTDVLVFRQLADGKKAAARFDVSSIRDGSAPDPTMQSGDVVVVSTSFGKEAFNNFIKVLPLVSVFVTLL